MIRPTILALFLCLLLVAAANAQNDQPPIPMSASPFGKDDINIEAVGSAEAIVTYFNHPNGYSRNTVDTLSIEIEGLTITVEIELQVGKGAGGFAELIILRPFGGYVAIPDQAYVLDGDTKQFKILLPMF